MASNDDKSTEKYACDLCRSRKVTCSKERSGCQRCKSTGTTCAYSRSGVIRRNRKRKVEKSDRDSDAGSGHHHAAATGAGGAQSHLAADIEATRAQLSSLDVPGQSSSLNALQTLAEASANTGIRLEESGLDRIDRGFFCFEEHAAEWGEVFEDVLQKSGPLVNTPPPDVMNHLRAARPHLVRERAWLVMYYSAILGRVTSTPLKDKLHSNLWLSLSDVRVLLEPSENNITALLLALSQASDFTGPSLCWMLATNACRMLQALGVNQRSLGKQTRERRVTRFWHLNLLDKGLAIIFGRTPTFHRAMVKEIGLPTMEQIQPSRSHITSTGTPGFFGAHYMYQKILLSHIMGDIWYCLWEEQKPNHGSIQAVRKDLESWHEEARKILEAAAISEKPFCDAKNARSMDIGIHTIDFHFLYLDILLTRSAAETKEQCLGASTRMLHLLQHMAPDSREPYHPVIWQLICCPFTPMLMLFRELISKGEGNLEQKRAGLLAMERLPTYLKALSSRNSLAARLQGIALVLVQHARSVMQSGSAQMGARNSAVQRSASQNGILSEDLPPYADSIPLDSFGSDVASLFPSTLQSDMANSGAEFSNDFAMFANDFDMDTMFDWLSWDSRAQ